VKRVFRVAFEGVDADVVKITERAVMDVLIEGKCPLRFVEAEVNEVLPKATDTPHRGVATATAAGTAAITTEGK
jgi:hypothetical protein